MFLCRNFVIYQGLKILFLKQYIYSKRWTFCRVIYAEVFFQIENDY